MIGNTYWQLSQRWWRSEEHCLVFFLLKSPDIKRWLLVKSRVFVRYSFFQAFAWLASLRSRYQKAGEGRREGPDFGGSWYFLMVLKMRLSTFLWDDCSVFSSIDCSYRVYIYIEYTDYIYIHSWNDNSGFSSKARNAKRIEWGYLCPDHFWVGVPFQVSVRISKFRSAKLLRCRTAEHLLMFAQHPSFCFKLFVRCSNPWVSVLHLLL